MTFVTRRAGSFASVAALVAASIIAGPVAGAGAQAPVDPAATRVVGECKPGTGRIAVTVVPTAPSTYQVTVEATGLIEDSRWRAELSALGGGSSDEVNESFRRRATQGSWTFTTDIAFAEGNGTLFAVVARSSQEGVGDIVCTVDNGADGERTFGITVCAQGSHILLLRRPDDGTLAIRHLLFFGAPHTRWRLRLDVQGAEGRQSVTYHDVTNKRGVLRSRVELTGAFEDPVSTIRAESERGARCRLRINPGPLTAAPAGDALSPRELARLVSRQRG